MDSTDPTNGRTPSTRWEWKLCRVATPLAAQAARARRASSSVPLARRARREDLTITIRYRGGPESWWSLRARGRTWHYPGAMAIEDVFSDLYDGTRGQEV